MFTNKILFWKFRIISFSQDAKITLIERCNKKIIHNQDFPICFYIHHLSWMYRAIEQNTRNPGGHHSIIVNFARMWRRYESMVPLITILPWLLLPIYVFDGLIVLYLGNTIAPHFSQLLTTLLRFWHIYVDFWGWSFAVLLFRRLDVQSSSPSPSGRERREKRFPGQIWNFTDLEWKSAAKIFNPPY